MKLYQSFAEINRRLERLESTPRQAPKPASTQHKTPLSGLSVREIMNTGRHFIGWGWYPTDEEIRAIQGGAMVCFTESANGAAFVAVEGADARPLPAFDRVLLGRSRTDTPEPNA